MKMKNVPTHLATVTTKHRNQCFQNRTLLLIRKGVKANFHTKRSCRMK